MAEDTHAAPNLSPTPMESPSASKRSAAEAFDSDSVEDLKDKETTLDDVLVSPVPKKTRLLDDELPDVDDNEQFPTQEQELDVQLQLEMSENSDEALAPQEESEPNSLNNSLNNEIDIVDVDDVDSSGPGEFQQFSDDDEEETARAVARARNQREATQLLQQLDDSARSKLCLTALEKYGEELFFGHEDARDAILVDACAQDSILSLMRDAIRVRELYARGTAAAPVELDDDDETGGYEDEEEEKTEEEDDVVIISEEEKSDGVENDNSEKEKSDGVGNDNNDNSEEEDNAENGEVGSDEDEVGDVEAPTPAT